MAHATTRYRHFVVLHDDTLAIKFVHENHFARIKPAFIFKTRLDIELLVTEKVLSHFTQTGRTIGVNTDSLGGNARVIEQRAVLEVMIRVMMRDEDVAQSVERNTCRNQLPRYTIAAINDIKNVVN